MLLLKQVGFSQYATFLFIVFGCVVIKLYTLKRLAFHILNKTIVHAAPGTPYTKESSSLGTCCRPEQYHAAGALGHTHIEVTRLYRALYRKKITSTTKPEVRTCCNATRGEPIHGHGQQVQKV